MDTPTTDARRLLAERTMFVLDPEKWDRFMAVLDRAAMDKPRLKALLGSAGAFEDA